MLEGILAEPFKWLVGGLAILILSPLIVAYFIAVVVVFVVTLPLTIFLYLVGATVFIQPIIFGGAFLLTIGYLSQM